MARTRAGPTAENSWHGVTAATAFVVWFGGGEHKGLRASAEPHFCRVALHRFDAGAHGCLIRAASNSSASSALRIPAFVACRYSDAARAISRSRSTSAARLAICWRRAYTVSALIGRAT